MRIRASSGLSAAVINGVNRNARAMCMTVPMIIANHGGLSAVNVAANAYCERVRSTTNGPGPERS